MRLPVFNRAPGSPASPAGHLDGPVRRGVVGDGDVANRLPDDARRRLKDWRALRDEQRAAIEPLRLQFDAARQARDDAANRLNDLVGPHAWHRERGGRLSENEPDVTEARRRLDQTTQDFNSLREKIDAKHHRVGAVIALVNRAETWLAALPAGTKISPHPVNVKLRKGERAEDALSRIQGEREQLLADLHTARSAPRPSSEVKEAARAEIARLAEKGTPDLWGAIEHGGPIQWPSNLIAADVHGNAATGEGLAAVHGRATVEAPDALALIAHLFADKLIKTIEAQIDSISDDVVALSAEERREREAELQAKILEAERMEAALCVQIGELLDASLDPRALLGVDGPSTLGA